MSNCVIEVGHLSGTPATWVNADIPEHLVCDRHKDQYETAWNLGPIMWKRISKNQSTSTLELYSEEN